MNLEQLVEKKGAEWLATTVSRLTNNLNGDFSVGSIITTITVDIQLEKDLREEAGINRNNIYDGLQALLWEGAEQLAGLY